ncbi:MAG: AIR carboxylase family protein, partial [Calditrichaeota bacterium]
PKETAEFAERARDQGYRVIIAIAGMAAHLPGVIAASTTLPVIGVPMPNSSLNGVDALYSMVQMPAGVPVATVAIGAAGAANAAVLAAEILALSDAEVLDRLREFKESGCRI